MRIIASLFDEHRPDLGLAVPFIAFQETVLRRTPLEADTTTDLGRFAGLMWYVEHYVSHQKPFKAPLSGAQARWLLESNDALMEPRPLPRIVEWFRRRAVVADPYRDREGYLDVAYWWSVEKAVALNVEHVLVPDAFIASLMETSPGSPPGEVPVTAFLARHALSRPQSAWAFDTESRRLGAYMRVLMEPDGVHYGLFLPPGVLHRIATASDVAGEAAGAPAALADVRRRATESLAYADRHRRLRSGREDSSASLLGQDWMAQAWRPPPAVRGARGAGPKPDASVLPFPVRVIGPLNSESGLGQAARLSISALESAGVVIEGVDFMFENPAPRGAYVRSVTPSRTPFAVNLLHLNAESLPAAPAFLAPATFENAYNIGYFFWELPHPARCHQLAMRQLDEIWVASEFDREVYAPTAPCPVTRVGMAVEAPGALPDRAQVRAAYGLPASATVFIATFDSFSFLARKNPLAVVRAFLQAFPSGAEDVRLVVKTHNLMTSLSGAGAEAVRQQLLSLCASDPRITLLNETLAYDDLLALKAAADVYVSLHRSEGWGFGMLESMRLGVPSIATAFSGNMDFCSEETGWLVPWTRRYVAPGEYAFFTPGDWWADPDVAVAAAMMRAAAANPDEVRRRGAAAKAKAEAQFSPAAIGAVYLARLRAIAAEPGVAG